MEKDSQLHSLQNLYFYNLFVMSINFSNDWSASPLSIAHLARRTPSFQRPPPGPRSVRTLPSSPGPMLLVLASQTPDVTRRAATFMSTKSKRGSLRGSSLRRMLINFVAFSLGIFFP